MQIFACLLGAEFLNRSAVTIYFHFPALIRSPWRCSCQRDTVESSWWVEDVAVAGHHLVTLRRWYSVIMRRKLEWGQCTTDSDLARASSVSSVEPGIGKPETLSWSRPRPWIFHNGGWCSVRQKAADFSLQGYSFIQNKLPWKNSTSDTGSIISPRSPWLMFLRQSQYQRHGSWATCRYHVVSSLIVLCMYSVL